LIFQIIKSISYLPEKLDTSETVTMTYDGNNDFFMRNPVKTTNNPFFFQVTVFYAMEKYTWALGKCRP
jgi:hypothetical protein